MYGDGNGSLAATTATAAVEDTDDKETDVKLEYEENECGCEPVDDKLEADSGEE